MTSPPPSGGPSRRRVAGLALVGVGVIAAIIGLGSLALDGGGQTAAPPPGSATPDTTAPSAAPTTALAAPTSNPVAVPTFATPPPDAGAPPGGTAAPAPAPGGEQGGTEPGGTDAAGGDGGGTGVAHGTLRVYNNSTITGLASDAAADFRRSGWEVGEVANYPFGIIRTTTVYYRPGTSEQGQAEELGRQFDMRVSERFEGLQDASPGVIVIVTNDYKGL